MLADGAVGQRGIHEFHEGLALPGPLLAHLLEPAGQRLLVRLHEAGMGPAEDGPEVVEQPLRRRPELQEGRGMGLRAGEDLVAPVVGGGLALDLAIIDLFAAIEGQDAGERVFADGPVGEAVDGGDGRLVDARRRLAQASCDRGTLLIGARDHGLGERGLRVRGDVARRLGGHARGEGEARAQAFAQLLGGGAGERHHEDLAHLELALDDEACIESGQAEGLARARAGLDQPDAVERHRGRVERLDGGALGVAHAASPGSARCWWIGLATVSAI